VPLLLLPDHRIAQEERISHDTGETDENELRHMHAARNLKVNDLQAQCEKM
jgi:hypothetical protein